MKTFPEVIVIIKIELWGYEMAKQVNAKPDNLSQILGTQVVGRKT